MALQGCLPAIASAAIIFDNLVTGDRGRRTTGLWLAGASVGSSTRGRRCELAWSDGLV